MDLSKLGKGLKKLREKKGWSTYDLAAAVDLSQAYVSMLEAGKRGPTLETLDRVVETLGGKLNVAIDTGIEQPEIGANLADPDDRDYLRELAALVPEVRDPLEREVFIRSLRLAAEREQERRQQGGRKSARS